MSRRKWSLITRAALASLLSSATLVHATDGYFLPGYGAKAEGVGGASVAFPQDAIAPAANPAGIAFLDNRLDVGVDYFHPSRSGKITGNQLPPGYPDVNGSYDANGKKNFFIPQIGYARPIGDKFNAGIAVYGNGGLNTSYTKSIGLFGSSKAGVNISQLFVTPTVSYKITENHSVGLGVNFLYQQFKATGLENFTAPGYSESPENLTNRGNDTSTGWGARVGWTGKVSSIITVGATYQTKTKASEFKKYKGLFAGKGGFDVPANYAAGIAVKATPKLTVAADVEKIEYSKIKSVGTKLLPALGTAQLGSNDGAGFGWKDVVEEKIGVAYDLNDIWTVRAGYNHSSQPIPTSETLFNLLAPAVIENHATLGATVKTSKTTDVSLAYVHAFKKTVNGSNSIPSSFGGGEADLTMSQDSVSAAFGVRF
jgi:long-chain fatty acid transport protein